MSFFNDVKKHISDHSWFEIDYEQNGFISFFTRENGNVGDETPGEEDINKAIELVMDINKKFPELIADWEECDEWIHINITIK